MNKILKERLASCKDALSLAFTAVQIFTKGLKRHKLMSCLQDSWVDPMPQQIGWSPAQELLPDGICRLLGH